MNILFFSKLIPQVIEKEVKDNTLSGMFASGVEFQKKIISGLEQNIYESVILNNVLPVYSYPDKYSERYIRDFRFEHTNGQRIKDYNVAFDNMRIIKQIKMPFSIKKSTKRIIKENDIDVAVFYSADRRFSSCYRYLKRNGIKTVVIIPDLPEFNNVGKISLPMKIYQNISARVFRCRLRNVDGLVVLTKQTAEYLDKSKPYTVVEGIADIGDSAPVEAIDEYGKYLLYTGITHECYGLRDAVSAFVKADISDVKFIICGSGDSDEWLKAQAIENENIVYMGVVDHEKAHALQMNAEALINPRKNVGEFTKYSFPSKTMEYLASGKSVIAYMLDGMPSCYSKYIISPEDDSEEALVNCLREVFAMPDEERRAQGMRGREYVLKEKNPKMQCIKIAELLEKLLGLKRSSISPNKIKERK